MEIKKGFYDLCVPFNAQELPAILKELHEYGYRTVAIEQTFDHTKQAGRKQSGDLFPEPVNLASYREEFKNKLQLLNRLTIHYSDNVINHAMNQSSNLKKYHIVAGVPKNDQALQHCCSTFIGDIIGMNVDDRKSTMISHKFYQLAVRRGMCFELKYAPAIVDSTQRKTILTIAYTYASQKKSKNIIISSGAANKMQVRGPYDIANLGLLFGLSEEQSKGSITHVCRTLLLKSEARRYGKTVMFVKSIEDDVNSSDDEEDDDEEDEAGCNESDDDDSMEGHPTKKKKFN